MHPLIAKIGSLYLYSYGLMVAIGFAVAALLAYRRAPEFGIARDKVLDFIIVILIGGIAGARALYIFTNMEYYIANPFEIINITKGGLVWYGGFIFGIIIAVIFVKINRIDFWKGADLLAPYMALAQGLGRIGCFLNGCCYGSAVSSGCILSVIFPGESVFRHPTQIYSACFLIILYIVLRIWQNKIHVNGEVFLGYAILSSLGRFGLEFVRGDNPKVFAGLTMSQLISIGILISSFIILICRHNLWKKKHSISA